MSEWVQPEHREIHEFLIHWGRWLRSSYQQGHCGSIEHRWKSPQCWYPLEPKPEPPEEQKALAVERCMRIIYKTPRRILKFKYVYRADREWIVKRMRLKDYDQDLYTARQIVLNLLRVQIFPHSHGTFHHLDLTKAVVSTNVSQSRAASGLAETRSNREPLSL